jgi:hypothetical protein
MAEELVLDIKTNLGQATKDTKDYKKSLEQINEEISIQNEEIVRQEKILIKLKAQQDKNSKGGWSAGMSKLNDKIRDTSELLDLEKNTLKGLNNKKKEATQVVKKNTQALKEGNKESKESIANFKFMGVSLNGVKKGFSQIIPTAKAMFGTIKAGIMSTGIGALVLAVIALTQSFKRSEEGQEKFQRIMAAIGTVTSQVLDLFSDLGETIIDTFTNPLESIKSVGKSIGKFLSDPIKGTRDLFVKATVAVKTFVKETKTEIEAIDEVTKARQKAHHIDRELKVERANANREINDLRLQAEDREKFNATERIELLRKAQKIEQDITDKEIESKQILIDAQIKEMDQGKNNIEAKDKLAQLQADLIDLDTKRLRSQRLLQTQITTANTQRLSEIEDEKKALDDLYDQQIAQALAWEKRANQLLDDENKANKKAIDEQKKLEFDLRNFKQDMAVQGLGVIKDIAGEGTAIGKAAAISQATISGIQGVQNAFTSANANVALTAATAGAYPIAMATAAGVFSAMNIAKIASGGGGGVTPPSTGGGGRAAAATPAPQMMSGAFELSGGVAPEAMKAFVVTDEMSNSQNQLANIRRRATI